MAWCQKPSMYDLQSHPAKSNFWPQTEGNCVEFQLTEFCLYPSPSDHQLTVIWRRVTTRELFCQPSPLKIVGKPPVPFIDSWGLSCHHPHTHFFSDRQCTTLHKLVTKRNRELLALSACKPGFKAVVANTLRRCATVSSSADEQYHRNSA